MLRVELDNSVQVESRLLFVQLRDYFGFSVATPPRTSIAKGTDTGGSAGDMATLAQRLNMDTGACAC